MGQIALPYDNLKTAILVLRDVQVQGKVSISATARCPWRRAPCPTLPYIYLHLKICIIREIMNPTTCMVYMYIHAGNTGSSFLCPLTRQEDSILLQSSLNSGSEIFFLLFICSTTVSRFCLAAVQGQLKERPRRTN